MQKILPEDAEKIQDKKRRGQKSAKDPQQANTGGYDPRVDLENIPKRRGNVAIPKRDDGYVPNRR